MTKYTDVYVVICTDFFKPGVVAVCRQLGAARLQVEILRRMGMSSKIVSAPMVEL